MPESSPTRERLKEIFHKVGEHCDLPPMPTVAARAMTLAGDPDAKVEEITRVVATDGTLAARVLRIANSASYVQRHAPRTLRDAIFTVGFQTLRRILVAASCRQLYRADDRIAETLWGHALAAALAADELAVVAREPRGGNSFIAGLLHDIGRLVFHISDPDAYAELPDHDEEAEIALFGVTHASVAGCLAEKWGLDDELIEALVFHHAPSGPRLAARIATADRIALAIGWGELPAEPDPLLRASAEEDPDLAPVTAKVTEAIATERSLFE